MSRKPEVIEQWSEWWQEKSASISIKPNPHHVVWRAVVGSLSDYELMCVKLTYSTTQHSFDSVFVDIVEKELLDREIEKILLSKDS